MHANITILVKVNLGVQFTFILIQRRCYFKGRFSRSFRHMYI